MKNQHLKKNLISEDLDSETLVFDPELGLAHKLDGPARDLFLKLQENSSIKDCRALFSSDSELEEQLSHLAEVGLLQTDKSKSSRRSFLAKASALPFILSVALPSPASAQSGLSLIHI